MATNTAGNSGQKYQTNQTHYLLKRVRYSDFTTANAAMTVGVLPPGAVVTTSRSRTSFANAAQVMRFSSWPSSMRSRRVWSAGLNYGAGSRFCASSP